MTSRRRLRARNDNNSDVFGYDRREGGHELENKRVMTSDAEGGKKTRFVFCFYFSSVCANVIRFDDANQCVGYESECDISYRASVWSMFMECPKFRAKGTAPN